MKRETRQSGDTQVPVKMEWGLDPDLHHLWGRSLWVRTTWGSPGAQLSGASVVQELTALVCITKRIKNRAPSREQLEKVPLEGKNLLNPLKKETCRTGGPEKGQKGQWKQLPTSASANQPATWRTHGHWAWGMEWDLLRHWDQTASQGLLTIQAGTEAADSPHKLAINVITVICCSDLWRTGTWQLQPQA